MLKKGSLAYDNEKALLKQNSNAAMRELTYIIRTLEKLNETEKANKVTKLMRDISFIIYNL